MKTSKIWNEAIELLKQLNPSASQEELEKVADFGFGLAATPKHFIEAIKKELNKKIQL